MPAKGKYPAPGVYMEELLPAPPARLRTGVPVFLGYAGRRADEATRGATTRTLPEWGPYVRWDDFHQLHPEPSVFLAEAVRGFFQNAAGSAAAGGVGSFGAQGPLCYVVPLRRPLGEGSYAERAEVLAEGLAEIEYIEDADLVCVPDIAAAAVDPPLDMDPITCAAALQAALLEKCRGLGDRFAILDSVYGSNPQQMLEHCVALPSPWSDRPAAGGAAFEAALVRYWPDGEYGALYYPWIQVLDGPARTGGFVPPCGHVAGVYSRMDARFGPHRAPANEVLAGALDLEFDLGNDGQGRLNPVGVNCLRVFGTRGIRVWGARTLARNPFWTYVNVRRIFLTAARWIRRNMAYAPFEPLDTALLGRVEADLNAYCLDLYRQGALQGASAEEAYFVRCNEQTNPPETRELGQLIAEIGLAAAVPNEFIIVRIVQSAGGATTIEAPVANGASV